MSVSAEQLIAEAKVYLRLTDTTDPDMVLERYLFDAFDSLKSLDVFVKRQEEIDIEDNRFPLPVGFKKLIAFKFSGEQVEDDDADSEASSICSPILYVDMPFLFSQGCNCSGSSYSNYSNAGEIIGDEFVFHGVATATKVIISFYGLRVDENGVPCFSDDHKRACRAYACWRYAESFPQLPGDRSGYTARQAETFRREWVGQKRWVRGNAVKQDAERRRAEIMSVMNAMFVNKNPFYR